MCSSGMERAQLAEPRHQPMRGEERQHAEPQPHQLGIAVGALHRVAELVERRADLGEQPLAVGVEMDGLVAPLEQGAADDGVRAPGCGG